MKRTFELSYIWNSAHGYGKHGCIFTYQIDRQSQLLNDLAIVAETHKPVVNNKSELLDAFAKYINAAGLKPESQKQSNVGYRTGNKPDTAYAPSTDNERIYGNPDAQFYIIEYSDFECQYCKQHFPIVMDLVDSSQGILRWFSNMFLFTGRLPVLKL
jgi:hypothetical protein